MEEVLKPTRIRATQLNAWPVVSSLLFEHAPASDDIVSIVSRAGLSVDWNLNSKEAFSHSTRKRAYQPRIHAAYSALSSEDCDTVLPLIIGELVRKFPMHIEVVKFSLSRIGWTLKTLKDPVLTTNEPPLIMKRNKELQRLILLQVRDGVVVHTHTPNQDFLGSIEDKRARAMWVHAFNELVHAGCFESTRSSGIYTVTHLGYQFADYLKKQNEVKREK